MKLNAYSFAIAICSLFFLKTSDAFSQQASTQQELVLEVSTVTTKNYTEVKNALLTIDGLTLVAFCEDYKYFLIYYDTNKIESENEIEKVIGQLNPTYKTKKIYHTKFSEIIGMCNVFPANNINTTK